MFLLFSILLVLLVIYRVGQYLEARSKKAPVQYIPAFGRSHDCPRAVKKQPKNNKPEQFDLLEEANERLAHWFVTPPTEERDKLRKQLKQERNKIMRNRTRLPV